jgi:hypothetical protein
MLVEALADYERSEDLGKQTKEDFVAQLPARREVLHKRIPTVTVLTPPAVADALVSVDGRVVPPTFLGKPIPLNPGHHKLMVAAPGRTAFAFELSLKEGEALVTSATMPPVEDQGGVSSLPLEANAAQAQPEARAPSPRPVSPARTYVLLGEATLAVGTLAVGIGYTLAATSADARADSVQNTMLGASTMICKVSNPAPCRELQHFVELARNDRFIALLGFIGAGVSTAALAGTFVLWPGSSAKVAIVPNWVPSAAGISVVGRF